MKALKTSGDAASLLLSGERTRRFLDLATVAFFIFLAAAVTRFASVQDVWIDETTQLSGAALPLPTLFAWLSGDAPKLFPGIPDDRMPPVSYLLDWLWLRLAGDAPFGFRLFHGALALGGAAYLALHLRKSFGAAAGLVFAAVIALSPTVISTAPEIRAYPIFFALTCASLVSFLKVNSSTWNGALKEPVLLAVLCVLNIYTHFYGLIASGAMFAALLARHIRNFSAVNTIILTGATVAVLSLGLAPFVLASAAISQPVDAASSLGDYTEYLLKLVASPAHMIAPATILAYLAGFGALGLAAAFLSYKSLREPSASEAPTAIRSLIIVAALGVMAPIIANILSSRFYAIKISYSFWLFPVLASLAAISAANISGIAIWDRYGRFAAVGLMLLGGALAASLFMSRQKLFIHGPGQVIVDEIANASGPVELIYEKGADFGFAAIPLVRRKGANFPQWTAVDDQSNTLKQYPLRTPQDRTAADFSGPGAARTLLIVQIEMNSFKDLRAPINGAPGAARPDGFAQQFQADPHWSLMDVREYPGLYAARIWRFERVEQGND